MELNQGKSENSINSRYNQGNIREIAFTCFFNKSIFKYVEKIARKQTMQIMTLIVSIFLMKLEHDIWL